MYKVILVISLLIQFGWAFTIDSIAIPDSLKTKESTLYRILGLEVPFDYTDSLASLIYFRLNNSTLFDSVTIDTFVCNNHNTLKIGLVDKSSLYLSDIGGGLYGERYGEEVFPWLRFNMAGTFRNIKGSGQSVTIAGEVFRIRKLGIIWRALLSKGIFLEVGASIGSQPSIYDTWDNTLEFLGGIGVGKIINKNSYLNFRITPEYNTIELLNENLLDDYWEVISTFSVVFDYRPNKLNPNNGFYIEQNISTNSLYPYINYSSLDREYYISGVTDIRKFISPFRNKSLIFAFQGLADLTYLGQQNRYNKYYLGGSDYLRGFPGGTFGKDNIFSNRGTVTAEFRFPIYRFSDVNLGFLSWYDKSMKHFIFDIEGGVFVDAGYLWQDINETFVKDNGSATVSAAGVGIRVLFPTINMAICGDFGWPIYAPREMYSAVPSIHGYVNLPF